MMSQNDGKANKDTKIFKLSNKMNEYYGKASDKKLSEDLKKAGFRLKEAKKK